MLTIAAGVDRDTLDLILQSLREFARDHLDERTLLDLDARDECPVKVVPLPTRDHLQRIAGVQGGAFEDLAAVRDALYAT